MSPDGEMNVRGREGYRRRATDQRECRENEPLVSDRVGIKRVDRQAHDSQAGKYHRSQVNLSESRETCLGHHWRPYVSAQLVPNNNVPHHPSTTLS